MLGTNLTKRELNQEDTLKLVPCKVAEKNPEVPWPMVYKCVRLKGISPDSKSFLFKLIHLLLPSRERVHHLSQNNSPLCWCNTGATETYQHLFLGCEQNREAGQALLNCVSTNDRTLTAIKMLRLELDTDEPFLLASVSILAKGLEFIWENRKVRKRFFCTV